MQEQTPNPPKHFVIEIVKTNIIVFLQQQQQQQQKYDFPHCCKHLLIDDSLLKHETVFR